MFEQRGARVVVDARVIHRHVDLVVVLVTAVCASAVAVDLIGEDYLLAFLVGQALIVEIAAEIMPTRRFYIVGTGLVAVEQIAVGTVHRYALVVHRLSGT